MSSPITFSGFNNIDFNIVLNALMQQASQPLTVLQDRQKALRSQITEYEALAASISSLRDAADGLDDAASLSTLTGISSDSAVSVTTGTGAQAGHYDVVVNELARAQVTASTSTTPDATTTIVATGGTLTIGGVDVAISADSTLQDIASAINSTADIGVTAAVIRSGSGAYRLALTSSLTGAANAFTVINGLTGGTGLTFGDDDQNGVSGDSAIDNAVVATDAAILINNIPVTGDSNTFEDVLPGVTLTISKKDPTKTIAVDVTPDSASLKTKVESFISAYNALVKFLDTQRTSAGKGEAGSIGREPMLRQLKNSLRNELVGAHGSASVTRLAEVGVEFTSTGTLRLNEGVFNEAVETNGDDIRALFAGVGGVFPAIDTVLADYSASSGLISDVKTRLTRQISAMDGQISAMQARLALQRASLQRQFTEADAVMSRLNSQSGSLASLGAGFGQF